VLLLQLSNGQTHKLDPRVEEDLCVLDNHLIQRQIRRVSILNGRGHRVDLPLNVDGIYRLWVEQIRKNGSVKGERFCMKTESLLIRALLYYSDGRVVFDIDMKGGFING
jgi:hypothetical protein